MSMKAKGLELGDDFEGSRRVGLMHISENPETRSQREGQADFDCWVGSGRDPDHQPHGPWEAWAVLADQILRHPNTKAVRPDLFTGQADDGGDGVNCPACDAGTYGGHLCGPAVITEYRWKYRPGRRSSGAQRGGGKVLHLVEHQRDHGPALCGARPGRTSAWAEDPTAPPGSMRLCEKCQRRYAEPGDGAGGAS